ncbi:uridine phosphorylase [Marinirhabdus gelatinilytica]|uniref:Uridine phosphorylase n=2 Tax=Marinirhabdus gelatinilytica TaxID=1703343 RepID=A0A370QA38_9FLAO|nr:uridine phosphorylase [Marinirhabdus gelatinilytica]
MATTIITVGDPDRVSDVTNYFDSIECTVHKREFKTQTGTYKGKRLTVISTGIGTDNIDIVLNELDALANIDLNSRTIRENHTELTFVRIGTSGAIQEGIPLDSFLVSEKAIGFDGLLHYYGNTDFLDQDFSEAFKEHTNWSIHKSSPYVVSGNDTLVSTFVSEGFLKGVTATNVGFYGPQGRKLRLSLQDGELNNKLHSFEYKGQNITNLEMETSGIYGLAKLLGHRAVSLNAILANRATGDFSKNPKQTIDSLIVKTLDLLVDEKN